MKYGSKLPHARSEILADINCLAKKHNAIDLVNGIPNISCSSDLIDLVCQFMHKGYNQYAPVQGLESLREIIAEKTEKLYSFNYHPDDEITITAGATQAIYTVISSFINEGDEVIVFEPSYYSYVPGIEINGGIPRYVQLKKPDFKINWKEVEKLINSKTRMIIINSPHYPTGTIISAFDLEKLNKIISGTNIIILSDEVFEHIIYDKIDHQSVARFPDLVKRSFIVSSFGKTFHITGWKVGYCMAPKEMMKEFRKTHQFLISSIHSPVQYALAEFLKRQKEYLELGAFYQKKRDQFNSMIGDSNFIIRPSMGTYFQLLDYSRISEEDEMTFAKRLLTENNVASIPISSFYHKNTENKTLGFCFSRSDEILEKAAERLIKL